MTNGKPKPAMSRLEIAAMMLQGCGKLDTDKEQKNQLVDNALYLADRLIQREREMPAC